MPDLPMPGDPLVIRTGIVVEETSVAKDSYVSVDTYNERTAITRFVKFNPVHELTLKELPEQDIDNQNAIALVIGLRLLGLTNTDIADMTSVPLSTIEELSATPAAQATFEAMLRNVINHRATTLQGRIASYADDAVGVVTKLMSDEDVREDVRLKAAQDILDRSGTKPDQFFRRDNGSNGGMDELTIVVTDETSEREKIKVNVKRK